MSWIDTSELLSSVGCGEPHIEIIKCHGSTFPPCVSDDDSELMTVCCRTSMQSGPTGPNLTNWVKPDRKQGPKSVRPVYSNLGAAKSELNPHLA